MADETEVLQSLSIDTGTKKVGGLKIEIKDGDGNRRGIVQFNPADPTFINNFYECVQTFNTKLNEYQEKYALLGGESEIDISSEIADGINPDSLFGKRLALVVETCDFIRGRIDFVFGPGTSEVCFGDSRLLDAFGQFFDGINPIIEKHRGPQVSKYLKLKKGPKNAPSVME